VDADEIPDTATIFGWIEEIYGWGVRRPAYPADVRAEDFILEQFTSFGLEDVRKEPAPLPRWEPLKQVLTVTSGSETFSVPCFPLPHSSPCSELRLELVEGDYEKDVTDKMVMASCPLMQLPAALMVEGDPILDQLGDQMQLQIHTGGRVIDPRGTFEGAVQILPFSLQIHYVMEPWIERGAAAFIGVLDDYPGNSHAYYVPYDGLERPIPGVWISGSDGARIRELLGQGDVSIELTVESTRETVTSHNVIGELPGAGDEWVIIGSHHDGPWSSAVEDGSGIALVLAQAAYWSRIPEAERPHNLLFLLNAGHMVGGAGCHAFIADHSDFLEKVVLEVHLEHAANEFRELEGELVATGEPEPRWFFTSRNPQLEQVVVDALTAEGVDRSLVIPPDAFGDQPTTDGGAFHPVGVPLVNYLTAPWYLFDEMDTLDKIHQPSLEPISRATIRIVEGMANFSAASMRAGISPVTDSSSR
jgi:hypothetical protein